MFPGPADLVKVPGQSKQGSNRVQEINPRLFISSIKKEEVVSNPDPRIKPGSMLPQKVLADILGPCHEMLLGVEPSPRKRSREIQTGNRFWSRCLNHWIKPCLKPNLSLDPAVT